MVIDSPPAAAMLERQCLCWSSCGPAAFSAVLFHSRSDLQDSTAVFFAGQFITQAAQKTAEK